MFALGMQSVPESMRSINWVRFRPGTRQRWEGEKGAGREKAGSGADAIRTRSQKGVGREVGAGRWVRTVGRALESLAQGREGTEESHDSISQVPKVLVTAEL